jgi:hypothetical protein
MRSIFVLSVLVTLLVGCDQRETTTAAEPVPSAPSTAPASEGTIWTSPGGRYQLVVGGWTVRSAQGEQLEAESLSGDVRLRMCGSDDSVVPDMSQAEANRRTASVNSENYAIAVEGVADVQVDKRQVGSVVMADLRYTQAGFQNRRVTFAIAEGADVHVINVTCGVSAPATADDIAVIDTLLNSLSLNAG